MKKSKYDGIFKICENSARQYLPKLSKPER